MKRALLWVAVAAFAGGAGCGAGEMPQFPTQGELQKMKAAPAPARIANPSLREVDAWDLKDPPAQPPEGPHAPAGPWEQLLADASKSRQGLLATPESMNCLARQLGQFYLAQQGVPSIELSDFMAARCAVVDSEVTTYFQSGTVTGTFSDAQLFQEYRAPMQEAISKQLSNGNQTAGIWFGRSEGRVVVSLVHTPRRIVLEHVPFAPKADGHVTLRGEILVPVENVTALINQGRFGVKGCTLDTQVRLPKFALDCPTSHDDPSAALEIGVFPPGRFTGKVVSHLVVWPSGQPGAHYARPSYATALESSSGVDLPKSLTTLLNSVRKEAGMPEVSLSADESATAAAVAPHYFAGMAGAEPEIVVDQVVMGLRAGWQIPGLVGYGQFTSSLTRDTANGGRLLASALDRPSGRDALLDPSIKVIAIGPVHSRQEGVLGVVFSSYAFLEPKAGAHEIGEVMALLTARRKEKGLSAPVLANEVQGAVAQASRKIERAESDPTSALDDAMRGSQGSFGAVQGWWVTVDKLEHAVFPEPLLTAPNLHLGVGVFHYKPKNFPWGLHGVLLVMRAPGQGLTAKSGDVTRF